MATAIERAMEKGDRERALVGQVAGHQAAIAALGGTYWEGRVSVLVGGANVAFRVQGCWYVGELQRFCDAVRTAAVMSELVHGFDKVESPVVVTWLVAGVS